MMDRRAMRARLVSAPPPPADAEGRPPVPGRFAEFRALEWIERDDLPPGFGPAEALRSHQAAPETPDEWQCRAAVRMARRRWRQARHAWAKANRYDVRELPVSGPQR
ncbi:hypothetical protein AB0H37_14675 [Actinomadura sp. NPDC023710]|uniref:hypothetical protein n=1 Tax=Actinomadura sp. NPDC023710 TaxID=3158219 RepID=UPI0033BFE134